jgi:hypothetical protein
MARRVKFRATIVGSEAWIKAMKRVPIRLAAKITDALFKIGNGVSTEAKKRVPVGARQTGSRRPGALRSSIRYEVISGVRTGAQVRIGTNIRYAPYIEFGTSRIAKGRVKALGRMQSAATDSSAIKNWSSKTKRGQAGASRPIMPFLRPAANAYVPRAKLHMMRAMRTVFIQSGFKTKTAGGS